MCFSAHDVPPFSVLVQMPFSNIVKYQFFSKYTSLLLSRSISHKPYDPPFSYIAKAPPISSKQPQNPSDPLTRKIPSESSLPFDFQYSYSESDAKVKPIGFREPTRFSPFGPGRLDRKWDGISAKFEGEIEKSRQLWLKEREEVLGESLSEEEVDELVEKYRHSDCSRQINLGNRGVTHNLLDDIHNHWKRAEAVRIKCLGVPTLDMDNVCFHLEDKTGGKIIHRKINILLLYRGRNYDSKQRPVIPLMLWKPLAPIYPKLIKNVADGLTFEEQKELRSAGLNSPALMKLTRNGVYVYVVDRIREAFESLEVVKLDCTHVEASTCKRIGVKLRDLVPCVPILFKDGQIIIWKGKKNQDNTTQ